LHAVDRNDFVRDGAANDIEPLAAAKSVTPPLAMQAFGIFAKEQIPAPFLIGAIEGWACDVRGAAANEFRFIAQAAPRAIELHHQCAIPAPAASSMRRPVLNRSS
jgi:hypothetical protein